MTRFNGIYQCGFYKSLNDMRLAESLNLKKKKIGPRKINAEFLRKINFLIINKLRVQRKQPPLQNIQLSLNNSELNLVKSFNISNKYSYSSLSDHLIKKR